MWLRIAACACQRRTRRPLHLTPVGNQHTVLALRVHIPSTIDAQSVCDPCAIRVRSACDPRVIRVRLVKEHGQERAVARLIFQRRASRSIEDSAIVAPFGV